jgi:hypothetical protein
MITARAVGDPALALTQLTFGVVSPALNTSVVQQGTDELRASRDALRQTTIAEVDGVEGVAHLSFA